jgi:RimJ/RimL family protein N-acetyltransferase
VRTACSWGCAASTTRSPTPTTSRWRGASRTDTGANGYATEAATAWLDHGFDTLGFPRIISITDTPNERSLAVMRRLGMTFDHAAQIEDEGEVFDAVIYSITAERWRERADR